MRAWHNIERTSLLVYFHFNKLASESISRFLDLLVYHKANSGCTLSRSTTTTMTGKSAPAFIPEWAEEKRVSIAAMVCFCILVLLCFFIFIPVAVTMGQVDGECFLYADLYGYGETSVCSYCIVCAVMVFVLCAFRLALLLYKLKAGSNGVIGKLTDFFSIWGVHLVIFVVDVCLLVLILVTACLISAGLSHLCDQLFGGRSACSSEEGVFLPDGSVNTSFYRSLTFAEGAAWATFGFWIFVVAYETIFAWKTGAIASLLVKKAERTTQNSAGPV